MRTDKVSRVIEASPSRIYAALTDRDAVQRWLPPTGARGRIDAFEPEPGGAFKMTLVFETPGEGGSRKSSVTSDVVDGEFVELVPDETIRQRFVFRSDDPAFAGSMTMTWSLAPEGSRTCVTVTVDDVPAGISPRDHSGIRRRRQGLSERRFSNRSVRSALRSICNG